MLSPASRITPARSCFLLAREAGVSVKPGAQAPGLAQQINIEPAKRATAHEPKQSVARFAGSMYIFVSLILGLAPQALRLRPLRGLGCYFISLILGLALYAYAHFAG
jgi:hypothetical protein